MTTFAYSARDGSGKAVRGVIEARSAGAAWRALRGADLQPVRVTRAVTGNRWRQWWIQKGPPRLSRAEMVSVTRQLAMLISAGTPVERALYTVSLSVSVRGHACLEAVRAGVVEGESLAEALVRAGFAPFYRAMVRAGEHGGHLDEALERLAWHLETSQNIRRKLVSSLAYPVILAVVAGGVVTALMVLVVPRLAEHLVDLGQELPVLTRVILAMSGWIAAYGAVALGLGAACCLGAMHLARAWPCRTAALVWSLPLFGGLWRDVAAARFCRAFAALTRSGMTVAEALHTAQQATTQPLARSALGQIGAAVDSGQPLGVAIDTSGVFPKLVAHMASGGEASGALAPLFDKSADYLESRISARTATLLAVVEPLIALVMGAAVLVVALAIMLPILRLNAAVLP